MVRTIVQCNNKGYNVIMACVMCTMYAQQQHNNNENVTISPYKSQQQQCSTTITRTIQRNNNNNTFNNHHIRMGIPNQQSWITTNNSLQQ